ncbi:hypothetical protein EBR21_10205 [bacterium]|nr:hypothetical protein [bacterium]
MKVNERVKMVVSIVAVVGSFAFLAQTLFPEEGEQLLLQMRSMWDNVLNPENANSQTPGSTKKRDRNKDKVGARGDTLNIESSVELESLSDEMVEDSLWEEGINRSRPEGVRSGQAVLEALNEIEGWSPIDNGYNPARLRMYLRYPKLWVRLSAYAFALKARVFNPGEESRLARLITLKNRDNPAQISRFLLRYERKDPALFEQLQKRLVQTNSPEPEKPPQLEDEEDGNDAS